jgi:hypothetical protein
MQSQHITREADSPFVHAVTRWVIGTDDRTLAVPDGCWDFVVVRHDADQMVLLTGQTTTAVPLVVRQ